MNGTEKQIAFANDIQKTFFDAAAQVLAAPIRAPHMTEGAFARRRAVFATWVELHRLNESAAWWINNRKNWSVAAAESVFNRLDSVSDTLLFEDIDMLVKQRIVGEQNLHPSQVPAEFRERCRVPYPHTSWEDAIQNWEE